MSSFSACLETNSTMHLTWMPNSKEFTTEMCGLNWIFSRSSENEEYCDMQCDIPKLAIIYFQIKENSYVLDDPHRKIPLYRDNIDDKNGENEYSMDVSISNFLIVQPSSFILNKLKQDDVTVIVENMEFYLNKCMLSFASPVFAAMFNGIHVEGKNHRVIMEDKKARELIDFFSTFYHDPSDIPQPLELNYVRARRLYPLYREFQMDKFVDKCEETFRKFYESEIRVSDTYIEEVFQHGVLAEIFDLHWLIDRVVHTLGELNSGIWTKHKLWSKLSRITQHQIFLSRLKNTGS